MTLVNDMYYHLCGGGFTRCKYGTLHKKVIVYGRRYGCGYVGVIRTGADTGGKRYVRSVVSSDKEVLTACAFLLIRFLT